MSLQGGRCFVSALGANQDVDVVHQPQPHIAVVTLRERSALERHRLDPGVRQVR